AATAPSPPRSMKSSKTSVATTANPGTRASICGKRAGSYSASSIALKKTRPLAFPPICPSPIRRSPDSKSSFLDRRTSPLTCLPRVLARMMLAPFRGVSPEILDHCALRLRRTVDCQEDPGCRRLVARRGASRDASGQAPASDQPCSGEPDAATGAGSALGDVIMDVTLRHIGPVTVVDLSGKL